jgi:aminopeptidase N
VDDDAKWWATHSGLSYDKFKYHNIMTEDLVQFFNDKTHRKLTAVFDQIPAPHGVPVLELKFDEPGRSVTAGRWTNQRSRCP